MTLLSWRRPALTRSPSARLLWESERAYWLAVGLEKGRLMVVAPRRWG